MVINRRRFLFIVIAMNNENIIGDLVKSWRWGTTQLQNRSATSQGIKQSCDHESLSPNGSQNGLVC
jgi:hypothetical protein